MAEEHIEQAENLEAPAPSKGGGIMGIVKAVAFITVIVIVEVVAASMLIPSASDTEKLAEEIATASSDAEAEAEAEENSEKADENPEEEEVFSEILVWADSVTRFDPEAGKTLTVDAEIHASVLAEEESEFSERLDKNQGRVAEQIVMTLQAADATDFTAAGLGLIKRKILEKTNRALGKPLVREVLFSKVNFVER